jgi:hypothetical protein
MSRQGILVIAAAVAVLTATAARAGGATTTFRDTVGDAGNGPDVTTVGVSQSHGAAIFAIHTASASSWDNAAAILSIDTDSNAATGDAGGETGFEAVYVLHSLHDQFTLDRSHGEHVATPRATWALTGGTLTITAPLSEFGGSGPFRFRVSTPAPSGGDTAPNKGEWSFDPSASKRRATSLAATFRPAAPRHGKRFRVSSARLAYSDGTHAAAGSKLHCAAKLAGHRHALRGSCRWRIPASAARKKLVVVVRAAGVKRRYTLRVR